MKLPDIAIELIRLVDGTGFKVEFTSTYVTLWLHGTEPLESFDFYDHHTEEGLAKTLKKATYSIKSLG